MTVRLETEKGRALARYVLAHTAGGGDPEYAARAWPESPSIAQALRTKATVAIGSVDGWGSDVVPTAVADDFIAAVRSQTVVDRLPVRRGPFQVPIPRESASTSMGGWAGQSAIPVGATTLESVSLPSYTLGSIGVFSNELMRSTRPGHVEAVRDLMVSAVVATQDAQFLDPSVALVAGGNPASVTSGATQVTSTGATAAVTLANFRDMIEAITTNLASPFWIMSKKDAVRIATTLTTGGALAFPTITALGGTLLGIPVLTTSAAPSAAGSPATDRVITLLDAASVIVADSGRIAVEMNRVSSVQMDSEPTQAGGASPSATNIVSAFQTESTLVKITRQISWLRAHSGAVSYMQVLY